MGLVRLRRYRVPFSLPLVAKYILSLLGKDENILLIAILFPLLLKREIMFILILLTISGKIISCLS